MIYKLYQYDNIVDLLFCDTNQTLLKRNTIMNDEVIKMHKGVDNTIDFRVFNRNRKPQPVDHLVVIAKIINADTDEKIFEKICYPGTERGTFRLFVSEYELSQFDSGFYTMVVVGEDNSEAFSYGITTRTPFYTDHDNEIVFDLEILNKADHRPETGFIIDESGWRLEEDNNQEGVSYSTPVPANQTKNKKNGVHTFALYAENFTGYIELYGTLDPQASNDIREYFLINITPLKTRINFTEFSGILPYTFAANFTWLKFKKFEDPENEGKITKILLRS